MRLLNNGRLLLAAWVLLTAAIVALIPSPSGRQLPAFLLLWVAPALSWSLWAIKGFATDSGLE
ncbi:MAG: hypothetical protein WAM60_00545, partial [Candidatus Promineifilaceae bacterium]